MDINLLRQRQILYCFGKSQMKNKNSGLFCQSYFLKDENQSLNQNTFSTSSHQRLLVIFQRLIHHI